MANPKKSPVVQFHVDCSLETKMRFAAIHEALGYKTKSETFAAMVYTISTKDTLDPHQIDRIEKKLDRALERYADLL